MAYRPNVEVLDLVFLPDTKGQALVVALGRYRPPERETALEGPDLSLYLLGPRVPSAAVAAEKDKKCREKKGMQAKPAANLPEKVKEREKLLAQLQLLDVAPVDGLREPLQLAYHSALGLVFVAGSLVDARASRSTAPVYADAPV